MAEQKTEQPWPWPTVHEDDSVWMSGFETGMGELTQLHIHAEPLNSRYRSFAEGGALVAAIGACAICGADQGLIEIKPRHRSRLSVWLCPSHIEQLTRPHSPFPGEDPHPPKRDFDNPRWLAGFKAGLLHSVMLLERPGPSTPEDARERHDNRLWNYQNELCQFCTGWSNHSWGNFRACHECIPYIAEVAKLQAWSRG